MLSKTIKICLLIDGWYPYWGGGQIHVLEVCKILVQKYNCKIDIYTRSLKDETGKIYNRNESYFNDKLNIYRYGIPSSFLNSFARIWWCFYIIFPLLFKKIDIIHAQAFLSAIPGKILKLIKRKPLIYSVHGTALGVWQELASGNSMKIQRWLERKLICGLKYDQEISASKDFLKYPNINKNIIVIPNGVDTKEFDKINVSRNKTFQILFAGRFDKIKGLDYLVDAIKKIADKKYKFSVILAGEGYYQEHIKNKIHRLNLDKYVNLPGKLTKKDLIKVYKSSNLFVLPSISEGQPLTLLEAWAAKLPVVVTNVGDNKEYVHNDVNGYIVPARDADSLANNILKILDNHSHAEKMGISGYNLVKQKYSWQNTAEKIYQVYKKFLK